MSKEKKGQWLKDEWVLAQVASALCEYKVLGDCEDETFKNCFVDVPDEEDSQEDVLIRHQAFESLSSEARNIADLIFNAPLELLELVSYRGKPSKERLSAFLVSMGWKKAKVKRAFHELQSYVGEYL